MFIPLGLQLVIFLRVILSEPVVVILGEISVDDFVVDLSLLARVLGGLLLATAGGSLR